MAPTNAIRTIEVDEEAGLVFEKNADIPLSGDAGEPQNMSSYHTMLVIADASLLPRSWSCKMQCLQTA